MRRVVLILLLWAPSALAQDGVWKGTLHRRTAFETRFHQAVYVEDLELTLRVTGTQVAGQGSARLTDPVITRIRQDPRYAQWSASYDPSIVVLSAEGSLSGPADKSMMQIRLATRGSASVLFHYRDGAGARTDERLEVPSLLTVSIPVGPQGVNRFSRHSTLAESQGLELPVDLAYFGEAVLGAEIQTSGQFERLTSPPRKMSAPAMLAATLAYLILVLPRLFLRPNSGFFASMMGTILGALDDFQFLGLGWLTARQARAACIAVAGLVEALELSRRYKSGTAIVRPTLAALLDIAAFVACAALTRFAMVYAGMTASRIGNFGAVAVGTFGAALITHFISTLRTLYSYRPSSPNI